MTARLLTLLALAVLLLAACNGGGDGATASVERYCDLVAELDAAGEAAFADLEQDPDATEEDYLEAERQFLDDNSSEIDDLADAAPDEIRDDVEMLTQAFRDYVASGDVEARESDEVLQAEQRILQFEEENCE